MKAASAPRREERSAGEQKEQTKKDGETPAPAVPEAPTHIPGRLFVGGLPRDVTPDALSNLLGAFGVRVEHVEFNTKHVPILGTNFAFVDVSPIEKTSVCVAKLNRTKWKGQSLRVELAKPSRLTKVLAHIHASDDEEAKEEAKPETAEEKKAKSKEGKRVGPWKRGKAGRLLPVLTLEKKNGRGTFIHDPAKTKHNITIFPSAMVETPDVPLSRLTYFYDESTAAAANATANTTTKKTNVSTGAGAMDTDDADEAEPVILRPPSPRPANDRVSAKLDREREFSLSLIESLVSTPPGSPPAGFDDDKEDDEEGYGGGGYDDDNDEEAQGQHDEFKAEWEKARQNAPCLWQHGPERKAERAALQQQQQQPKTTDKKQTQPKPQPAAAQAAKAKLEKERAEKKAKLEREMKAKMEEEDREKAKLLEKEREEKVKIEKEEKAKREKKEKEEKAKMEREKRKEKMEKERQEKENEEREKARVEKEKREKDKEERKKAKALKSAAEEEEGLGGMAVVEEEHTVVTTTTTTTTTQATGSETMETEEKRQDAPKSAETDQSGLRVGERGWWTSMLSTAAAAAAAPMPDAPKEASFSLFSILPTPPPVEEPKKTKAGGKAADPAIASALRSMKAAPKAAGTTSSPAGAGATTRKRPAPVVAPKRFLSACQDDDYSGPAFMRPDNWEQAEEEWASSRQALSHDYKSKFKTARKRQRATTADPSV